MSDRQTSVWILGDQLLAQHPALAAAEQSHAREDLNVVLVESTARSRRLPYQRKKLVLLFSAMRHYAADLRRQGYLIDYVSATAFLDGLRRHVAAWRPGRPFLMQASERQVRMLQQTRLAFVLGIQIHDRHFMEVRPSGNAGLSCQSSLDPLPLLSDPPNIRHGKP